MASQPDQRYSQSMEEPSKMPSPPAYSTDTKLSNHEEPNDTVSNPADLEAGAVPAPKPGDEDEFPTSGKTIGLIMASLYLSMFIVALDRTILGTAIPSITDDFHSVVDIGWYAGAYLFTNSAFQLVYGRIYTFYDPKWVLISAIFIFEIGSAVCATAPNSIAFIIGRSIAGLGAGGVFSGAINIMIITVPLHKRPLFQGLFGAVFGLASVGGPLIGGTFTTKLSWRWCFYINLPVGAVVVFILLFILKAKPSKNTDTLRQQFMKLDPLGTAMFIPGICCFLMALQWGGTTYNWGNWRIILLFILAAVLVGIFTWLQFRDSDFVTVPPHIIKQRSVAAGIYFSIVSQGVMMVVIYYLPIWFQAIKGVSAIHSGISTLPMVMSLVVGFLISGFITSKTGYFVGQMYVCSILMSIGAGLMTTLTPSTNHSHWIAYEFIFGFGLGFGMQQAGMAAQTSLSRRDVPTGVALMFFFQGIGGSVFTAIAEAIFSHSLLAYLGAIKDLPISAEDIVSTGATELQALVPDSFKEVVAIAYNMALKSAFQIAVGCACATVIAAMTMEWKNIKGLKHGGADGEAQKKREAEEKERAENQKLYDSQDTVVASTLTLGNELEMKDVKPADSERDSTLTLGDDTVERPEVHLERYFEAALGDRPVEPAEVHLK